MKTEFKNGKLTLFLEGRISSDNAASWEAQILEALKEQEGDFTPEFDAKDLDYISSAGLRVLLKVRKQRKESLVIKNVNQDVADIFATTGFNELFQVKKAFRQISLQGCELIGQGGTAKVYRIDPDTIVKVATKQTENDENILELIEKEIAASKKAFLLDIPTAISYDIVKCEEGYGEVYEVIQADTMAGVVKKHPERLEEITRMAANLALKLHSTDVSSSGLPKQKEKYVWAARQLHDYLTPEEMERLIHFIDQIPERNTFIHGDFHLKNIMLQGNEPMLIDMGEAGMGHPIFDLADLYLVYVNMPSHLKERYEPIVGLIPESASRIWDIFTKVYFADAGDQMEKRIKTVGKYTVLRDLLVVPLLGRALDPRYTNPRIETARRKLFPYLDEITHSLDW